MPEIRLRRVLGIALRQWLTLRHSIPRLFEVFYWPILEVVLWGLVTVGLILRFGRQVDVLAWSFAILFQPLVCAVYPLKVLHPSLQLVAGLLPPTHVFEAVRAASAGAPNPAELSIGIGGSAVALALTLAFYVSSLRYAHTMGRLASAGE